jgi:flagellar basal body-associated protein FliL
MAILPAPDDMIMMVKIIIIIIIIIVVVVVLFVLVVVVMVKNVMDCLDGKCWQEKTEVLQ